VNKALEEQKEKEAQQLRQCGFDSNSLVTGKGESKGGTNTEARGVDTKRVRRLG